MNLTHNITPFDIADAAIRIDRTESLNDEINQFSEFVASLNLSVDDNNDLVQAAIRLLSEAEKSGFVSGVQIGITLAKETKTELKTRPE